MCNSNSLMDSHSMETLNSQQSFRHTSSPVSSTDENLGELEVVNADDATEVSVEDVKAEEDEDGGDDEDDYIYNKRMIYSTHWSAPWISYGYGDRKKFTPDRSSSPEKSLYQEKSPSAEKNLYPEKSPSPEKNSYQEKSPSSNFDTSVVARNQRSLVGAGLMNLGNTCFLNAILQCFTHTMLFVQELSFSDHNCGSGHFCLLNSLRQHIELALASSGKIVEPWGLVENLSFSAKCHHTDFQNLSEHIPDSNQRRYRQEDAHEFLQCLLDRLENCCVDSRTQNKEMLFQDDNLVKRIFGGRLISKLCCCNCGYHSDTYESFIDISLEIEHEDSLAMALASFTKTEKIDDDTKFKCQNCKEYVSVEKQLLLDQVPQVAALHLKRFKNDGSWVEKIDKHVKFDMDLDLLPYTSGRSEDSRAIIYELYAMVVHSGCSPASGHYLCFMRSSPDTWYQLDDSMVKFVDEAWVLCQKAYILFYAKEGTPWLSSMSNTSPMSVVESMDIVCAPNQIMESSCNLNVHEIEHIGEETSIYELAESRRGRERMQMESAAGDTHTTGMPKPFHKELNNSEEVKEDKNSSQRANTPEQYEETCAKCSLVEVNCRASCTPGTPSRYQKPETDFRKAQEASCIRRKAEKEDSFKATRRKRSFKTLRLTGMPISRKLKYCTAMNRPTNRKNRKIRALSLSKKARSPAFHRDHRRHPLSR